MVDEIELCRLALALPESSYSGDAFEVNGKGFAWYYNQKVEGRKGRVQRRDVLAVRVGSLDEKDLLIASDPDKFFTDAHYTGFPAVLVVLEAVDSDEMAELLADAWCTKAPKRLVNQYKNERS